MVVVRSVARGEPKRHNLAEVVDHQVQFKAIEPAGGTFALVGKPLKDFMRPLPLHMADLQFFSVDKIVARALALMGFDQQH
jgi:hypothetical protein